MAESITIARPYARAAFEHAREQNALPVWSQLLSAARTAVEHPELAELLSSPHATAEELAQLIAEVCGNPADPAARNFLAILAENRRLDLLPEIAAIFEAERAEVEHVADVTVTSAIALTDLQRDRIAAALRKRLGCDVRLHCEVDPDLLGGALIRSGDLVIDGSLKSKLDRLSRQLAS
jgi:F-type H+-transporting ATPase subunit delta